MIPKPSTCDGCPVKPLSPYWVPDEVVPGAPVFILLQNPGENEVKGRRFLGYSGGSERWESHPPAPAIGKTGHFQEQRMFPLAGLERGINVNIGNVIRCRWGNTNELPPLSDVRVREAIIHCQRQHYRPPAATTLVVVQGEYALWAMTREAGHATKEITDEESEKGRTISSWRGWLLPRTPPTSPFDAPLEHRTIYTPKPHEVPVLAMYHTAYLFRAPWERTAAQRDWAKVGEFLAGRWPEPLPSIQRRPPDRWPVLSAFDTEFDPGTGHLIRYSMAYRDKRVPEPRVWVVESGYNLLTLPELPSVPPVVIMHNSPADLRYLGDILGGHDIEIEDTMIQHSLLWSDLAHNLGYLGSLYARTNRWKHLQDTNPVEYSAGDALGTWDAWSAMTHELDRDPATARLYATFVPLLPLIARSEAHGSRVNQQRVKEVIAELGVEQREATRQAQAHCGYPINMGSSAQVGRWLYDVEKVQRRPG